MKVTPEEVATYYDEWTPRYMTAFGPCIQANRPASDEELLQYIMDQIGFEPDFRVLDAGCGVCGPARYFAKRSGAQIEALTISPVQVGLACESNALAGLSDSIQVKVGDFHNLTSLYEENVFDRVYFLESLSHSADPAHVLTSVYQVLKPGGCVYIKDFFWRPSDEPFRQQQISEVVSRVNQAFKVETAWAADMVNHLTQAGLRQVFVRQPSFHSNISRWQSFENANHFQLYENGLPIDWAEWLEFKFYKPLLLG